LNEPNHDSLKYTPLYDLHLALGAKMVPFTGYAMPVQYPMGVLREHLHTRSSAGLFDVSHMGQVTVRGDDPAGALERLVPGNITGLEPGQIRYTQFTNDSGGILDDLMVTHRGDHLLLIVNAGCKHDDLALLKAGLGGDYTVEMNDNRGLIALQGPAAATVLARIAPRCAGLAFMTAEEVTISGIDCIVSRSGYTGEDGFEISLAAGDAESLWRLLLAEPEVEPIGLGARDSLRLEAGLCLYGHDIDSTTTPIEARLAWSIARRRRDEGGFPGAEVIQRQLADGVQRKRVGIAPVGRAPARDHTEITDGDGERIGEITSGGYGPSIQGPLAMGYVESAHAEVGHEVTLMVRGKPQPAHIASLPFVPNRFHKS
jgi:aminomethyltransferase